MKTKKLFTWKTLVILLFAIIICALCINMSIYMESKQIENVFLQRIGEQGYSKDDLAELTIAHSFLNKYVLDIDPWVIRVEYLDELGVLYWHNWENGEIIYTGTSGTPELNNGLFTPKHEL